MIEMRGESSVLVNEYQNVYKLMLQVYATYLIIKWNGIILWTANEPKLMQEKKGHHNWPASII